MTRLECLEVKCILVFCQSSLFMWYFPNQRIDTSEYIVQGFFSDDVSSRLLVGSQGLQAGRACFIETKSCIQGCLDGIPDGSVSTAAGTVYPPTQDCGRVVEGGCRMHTRQAEQQKPNAGPKNVTLLKFSPSPAMKKKALGK